MITNGLIARSVDLIRLEAGERDAVLAILQKMQAELIATLATQDDMTAWGKARIDQLLREIDTIIAKYYSDIGAATHSALSGLTGAEVAHVSELMQASIGVGVSLPTSTYMRTLAGNALIEGAPSAEWWAKQAGDVAFRFAAELRTGLASGETNAQLISRIIGKSGEPGVMDIARRNAAALVQTSVQTVANEARLETFQKNSDTIGALKYLSTLDDHVCPECAAHADLEWTVDGDPIGHDVPFEDPPLHYNCRCVIVPVSKTWAEQGVEGLPEIPQTGTRASMNGQVPATTTFEDWFSGRTVEQQNAQFGVGKATLFRDGKITLRDLINSQSGRPLTLEELRSLYE
jgi:SPP1 gp7 family putative phage head morphogenesis protein